MVENVDIFQIKILKIGKLKFPKPPTEEKNNSLKMKISFVMFE
jgi:hypothetical protein